MFKEQQEYKALKALPGFKALKAHQEQVQLLLRRLLLLRPGADDRQLEATASLSRDAVRDDAPGGHVDGRSRASIEGTKPFDPLGWLLRAGAAPVVEAHRRRARRRRLGHRRGA